MRLGVSVIDKNTKFEFREAGFGVLVDDTVGSIKDKVFAYDEEQAIMYYPNLVSVTVGTDIADDLSATVASYVKDGQMTNVTVYVSSLFTIIDQPNYSGFSLEPYDLYNKMLKSTEDLEQAQELQQPHDDIHQLYEALLKEFTGLTLQDLQILITIKMLSFAGENPGVITQSEMDRLTQDWETYSESVMETWQSKRMAYETERRTSEEFYELAYKTTDYSRYYESEHNVPRFIFTSITFHIKPPGYEHGVVGKFIKLLHIFNYLELTERIPFVAYNDSSRRDPKVKVYNRLVNTVSNNIIKSWILNERRQELSYKKVRGFMLKYRIPDLIVERIQDSYATVTLDENGYFVVKMSFSETDNETSIEKVKTVVVTMINDIIKTLNELYGVFLHSKRLQHVNTTDTIVHSLNATLTTHFLINKNRFRKMFTRYEISKLFEDKDVSVRDKRSDMISMYYKKIGRRETESGDSERLGITVNVRDNPYQLRSSLITIYDGYSIQQLTTIANQIIITSLLGESKEVGEFELESEEETDQVLRERSNIKAVRSRGGKIFSSKCQKPRQPVIDDTLQADPYRILEYEGNRYVCPGDTWKYPGFTSDNHVCCYDEPGKGMVRMLNTQILETRVQPSNLVITVTDPESGVRFDTFAIKMLSDVETQRDTSEYYYLDRTRTDFPLVAITDPELIRTIRETSERPGEETVWLREVPLSDLIMKPNKSNCGEQPDFERYDVGDINAVCSHHAGNTIFGYNNKSLPCCFDKPRPLYTLFKRVDTTSSKKHILKTDKLLDAKRQGVLPKGLNTLFNEIIRPPGGTLLRWGVYQNKLSFLNCIVECLSERSDVNITSTTELKRVFINYLRKNPSEFNRLNGGNIALKYSTLEDYITAIDDKTKVVPWTDIIDLAQTVIGCNIVVIDIPTVETQSTITYDYTNTQIVCNMQIKIDTNKPFVILLKKRDSFEIVVQDSTVSWDPATQREAVAPVGPKRKQVLRFVFVYDPKATPATNIANFLVDYYQSSCVRENEYPETFMYDSMYTLDEVVKMLEPTRHKILFQLVNSFNKATFVVTKRGLVIPIKETGMSPTLHWATVHSFIEKQKALPIAQLQRLLDEYNALPDVKQMQFLGATTETTTVGSNDGNVSVYTGLMTNFGQILPVKREPVTDDKTIQQLPIKYYPEVDSYLAGKVTDDSQNNTSTVWNSNIREQKATVFNLQKTLAKKISNDSALKTTITDIVKDTQTPRIQKIDSLVKVFQSVVKDADPFYLKHIANDVINDNIENLLLNNMVVSEIYNPDEIVRRNTESIWLNIDDIKRWLRKFKE